MKDDEISYRSLSATCATAAPDVRVGEACFCFRTDALWVEYLPQIVVEVHLKFVDKLVSLLILQIAVPISITQITGGANFVQVVVTTF